YAWRFDGVAIEGATNETLALVEVGPAAAGRYCVEITGPCASLTHCATLIVREEVSEFCTANQGFYGDTNGLLHGLPVLPFLVSLLEAEPLVLGQPGVRSWSIGLPDLYDL